MLPDPQELATLLSLYERLVGGRLNLAVSGGGQVAGASGTSDDVSNALDRALLVELRKQADIVVTSGASVRAEKLRASKHVPIVVLTRGSTIAGLESILDDSDRMAVTVFTISGSASALRRELEQAGFDNQVVEIADLAPSTVVKQLRQMSGPCLLFEFGPSLMRTWSTSGFIDEICLTTTGISEDFVTELPDFIRIDGVHLASSFYSHSASTRFDRFEILKSGR